VPRLSIPTLRVEELEGRLTPADVAVLSAQLLTPTTIQFTYQTTDDPVPFTVGVYRSADTVLDAGDVLVTSVQVAEPSAPEGSPSTIDLGAEMRIAAARDHVLVVADPGNTIVETDEANNTASFRKLALGVVVHGVQTSGTFPAWVTAMTAALEAKGYDDTIGYNWAAASRIPAPGVAALHGTRLAERIRLAADALATLPNDVVDLHLIGHSRGTVVVSRALLGLNADPGPPQLAIGYTKVTLLDPHPARNRAPLFNGLLELTNGTGVSTIGGFSFDPSFSTSLNAAITTLQFQAAVSDPRVVLPANVDETRLFFQRRMWFQTTTPFEQQLHFNVWGDRPQDVVNQSGHAIIAVNLAFVPSAAGLGHTRVQHWYLDMLTPGDTP
jgi:hypothetical protein